MYKLVFPIAFLFCHTLYAQVKTDSNTVVNQPPKLEKQNNKTASLKLKEKKEKGMRSMLAPAITMSYNCNIKVSNDGSDVLQNSFNTGLCDTTFVNFNPRFMYSPDNSKSDPSLKSNLQFGCRAFYWWEVGFGFGWFEGDFITEDLEESVSQTYFDSDNKAYTFTENYSLTSYSDYRSFYAYTRFQVPVIGGNKDEPMRFWSLDLYLQLAAYRNKSSLYEFIIEKPVFPTSFLASQNSDGSVDGPSVDWETIKTFEQTDAMKVNTSYSYALGVSITCAKFLTFYFDYTLLKASEETNFAFNFKQSGTSNESYLSFPAMYNSVSMFKLGMTIGIPFKNLD